MDLFQGSKHRLFTPAKCLFHRDKFLHGGKILSVISLLPGGCLSTVKYGTVWCGKREDSVAAYGRLYSKQLASFFITFLSTGVPTYGREYFFLSLTSSLAFLGIWPKSVEDGEVIYVMSKLEAIAWIDLGSFFSVTKESRCQIQALFQDSRMKMIPVINPKST